MVGKAGGRKKFNERGESILARGPLAPVAYLSGLGVRKCASQTPYHRCFFLFLPMLFLLVLSSPILGKKGQDYIEKDVLQAST